MKQIFSNSDELLLLLFFDMIVSSFLLTIINLSATFVKVHRNFTSPQVYGEPYGVSLFQLQIIAFIDYKNYFRILIAPSLQ